MKICELCKNKFEPRSNIVTICDNCKTLKCEICGKIYFAKRPRDVKSKHKYCSWECSCIGRGRTHTKNFQDFLLKNPNYICPSKKRRIENSKPRYSKTHFYDGYRLCWDVDLCIYGPKGKQKLYQYIWEKYIGPIPEGYVIHHKDGNHQNNCLYNLECLSRAKHIKKHNINRWNYPDPVRNEKGDG